MKERLLVSVTNGSNLKKKKQWVLVKLKHHNNKYKTKYVNGGEQVIFQKETFIFEVNEDVYPAGEMEIKVKTWEMLKSGETFCYAILPLAPITAEIRNLINDQSLTTSSSSNGTTSSPPPIYLDKIIQLKNKKGELSSTTSQNSTISLNFELVPENDSTTMKSLPLMFRWFPSLPHTEQVLSEFYCTKQAKKMVSMSHTGTMYITQNYIGFRSTSSLAKNKKTLIPIKDIKNIKKKIGSFYLPNAIQIRTTNKKKYLFASFIHRSKAYKVLTSQWILNGGNNQNTDNEDEDDDEDDDDDDDDQDDDEDNDDDGIDSYINNNSYDDQDDDELVNINTNSGYNSLKQVNSISNSKSNSSSSLKDREKTLSPLNKLTTSGGGKKRSLSISSSPNRNNTPTSQIIQLDNSNLIPQQQQQQQQLQQIKISIEIDDFEELGNSSNLITLTIPNDLLVEDLLDKLKSRFNTNIDLLSKYILVKGKNKKSITPTKRNSKKLNLPPILERQSSFSYIDSNSILKDQNSMLNIQTQSITLKHQVSASTPIINTPNTVNKINSINGNNSTTTTIMGERKFYILENDKTVLSYFSNNSNNSITELLYFKKNTIVKNINLLFELVEDKSRCIKLNFSIDSKIGEIYRELSTYIGKRITSDEHYFYIPKNGERGVILNQLKSLREYNITKSNTTIQVIKIPPFKSFIQKFKYYDKNDQNLLFELVQCCFSNSLPYMKPVDMENPQEFLDKLQHKLMIDDVGARSITKNLLTNSSFKDEGILIELKSRCESLLLNSNPYYSQSSFIEEQEETTSISNYEKWKSNELSQISHVMKSIIFKEDDFIGCVFIKIIQAEDIVLPGDSSSRLNEPINSYIIISNGEKLVKTKTIVNESNPNWSESFLIKIKKPRSKLELLIMNSSGSGNSSTDECIGIIEINVKDELEDEIDTIKEDWYSIKNKHYSTELGKINIITEYQYQFQEYNKYILELPKRQKEIDEHDAQHDEQHKCQVLHITLYSTLFNFILELQDNYKFSIKMNYNNNNNNNNNNKKKFINPFEETDDSNTNDDKEEDLWIQSYYRILIDQYSLRYGVSKSTTLVVQLSIMTDRYKIEMKPSLASSTTALSNKSKNYIIELQDLLENGIWEMINSTPFIFVKSELKSIYNSSTILFEQIKYTIGRFYESFPMNKPRGALKSLVVSLDLICKILNLNVSHNNDNIDGDGDGQSTNTTTLINFNQLLSKTIMFEQKKKFEENILAMGFFQLELSIKIKQVSEISLMMIELIGIIEEEVNNTLKFEPAFPIDVKITCDLIDVWGDCILNVMEDFCSWAPYHPNILLLVKRVLDYHNFTKSIAMERFKPMPLKQLFVTYVYKLLKEIKASLNNCCINSIKQDDKKTLASITLGHSYSFKIFFENCDQSLKDFDSLMWLPDSFSFVQLLEVISSEILHYVSLLKHDIFDWIEATEVESTDTKPSIFTLNIEPCIMYNNIEQCKSKLDSIATTIHSNLSNNFKERKKQSEHIDKCTKQCVEDSFKLCLDDSKRFIINSILEIESFFILRIKNYLFYCFQSVLFSDPLVLKNSHYTEPLVVTTINQDDNQVIDSTVPIQPPQYVFTPIQNSQSNSSGSLNNELVSPSQSQPSSSLNTSSTFNLRRFEKLILSQIKEFLTPKIEELYGKLRESSFKPFLKKLWCEIIEDLQYLLILRPVEKGRLPFHSSHVILNFDQISIVNSVIREMVVLFHRGGGGVATPILEEKLLPLRLLLTLSEMDTTSLIDQFNQNQKKLTNSFNGANSSNSNSSSISNSNSNSSSNLTKVTLSQLITTSQNEIILILSTRFQFDKEARNFVNKINGVVEKPIVVDGVDIDIETIEVIPESEFIIDKYHCSYNGQLGLLIISSRYLGFHNLLRQVGVSIGNKISVPLLNIVEIKKIKIAFIFNALQIKTSENKIYNFTGFMDRDLVYNDIIYQIKVIKKNSSKQQQQQQKS